MPLLKMTPGIALGIGPPVDIRKLGFHQLPDVRLVIESMHRELHLARQRPPQRRLARAACPRDAHYRNWRKKARTSCANNSGSSKAAKWPPLGISSHRRIWYDRSPHSRGGRAISWGNRAMPAGAGTFSSFPITHRLRWFSKYIRVEELIVCVTQ